MDVKLHDLDSRHQFDDLFARHHPDVLAYFLRRLDREDAIDASAEVFATAWRRIRDIPGGDESRMWLFGVARNEVRNRQRAARRRRRLIARAASFTSSATESGESQVVRRLEEESALAAVARLRPADREIVRLRLWEELAFTEIGLVCGCSAHAAEQRYARALKKLQSAFNHVGHVGMQGPSGPNPLEELREA